jgi:general secretion pathway protein G
MSRSRLSFSRMHAGLGLLLRHSKHQGGRAPRNDSPGIAGASAGFSLVEMLVVLTIIALILGLVGPRVLNYLGESRTKTAKLQIESFGSALDLFYLDAGRYPTSAEGLTALAQRPTGIEVWNGPYVKGGKVPPDPWGNAYQYHSPVDRAPYEIVSYGSDGHEGGTGTAADISNVEH